MAAAEAGHPIIPGTLLQYPILPQHTLPHKVLHLDHLFIYHHPVLLMNLPMVHRTIVYVIHHQPLVAYHWRLALLLPPALLQILLDQAQ